MEMGGSYEYYWEMQHLIEFEELSIFLAGDAQDDTLSCYDSSSLDGSMSNSSWAPAPVPKTVPAVADGKDAGGKAVAENRNIVMERDRRQKLEEKLNAPMDNRRRTISLGSATNTFEKRVNWFKPWFSPNRAETVRQVSTGWFRGLDGSHQPGEQA
ncbi:unnamed protein product [Urochloa humidicola]